MGKLSEKSKVPKPTALHKDLVTTAKRVAKEEANLVNDRNIKHHSSESDSETSLEHTDSDSNDPYHGQKPLEPTEAKKAFKTHFEDINERLQKLTVEVKKNAREYWHLFETSNAETDEHKNFILEND